MEEKKQNKSIVIGIVGSGKCGRSKLIEAILKDSKRNNKSINEINHKQALTLQTKIFVDDEGVKKL